MDRFPAAPVAATYREAYTTKNISAKTLNPSNPTPYKPETLNFYNWQAQTERMIPTFVRAGNFSSSLLLSSLKLSDSKVDEPEMRSLLGTALHFCEVVVLKLRTLPNTRVALPIKRLQGPLLKRNWIRFFILNSRSVT
jgi:hypothetical protein